MKSDFFFEANQPKFFFILLIKIASQTDTKEDQSVWPLITSDVITLLWQCSIFYSSWNVILHEFLHSESIPPLHILIDIFPLPHVIFIVNIFIDGWFFGAKSYCTNQFLADILILGTLVVTGVKKNPTCWDKIQMYYLTTLWHQSYVSFCGVNCQCWRENWSFSCTMESHMPLSFPWGAHYTVSNS